VPLGDSTLQPEITSVAFTSRSQLPSSNYSTIWIISLLMAMPEVALSKL
jgi:hypothetical protein